MDYFNLIVRLEHRRIPLSAANDLLVQFDGHLLSLQTQDVDKLRKSGGFFHLSRLAIYLDEQESLRDLIRQDE